MTYDVLVLGSVPASCALAGRLSENPDRTVCLVEAGPDYGHLLGRPAGRRTSSTARWLALARTSGRQATRATARRRARGSSAATRPTTPASLLEGAPSDYDEWGD